MSRNSFNLLRYALLCYIVFMEQDEYYTVDEFAKLMKVTPETIRRSIRAGKIAAIKFNDSVKGSWRISRHQFDIMSARYLQKYGEK